MSNKLDFFTNLTDIEIKVDYPLAEYTHFRTGGPAEILIQPQTAESAADVVAICREQDIPLQVLGKGCNVLVADRGIPGVTLLLAGKLARYDVAGDQLFLQAGLRIAEACALAARNSLAGLEFACGIPGSIGGALRMNAGAYDGSFQNLVVRTQYIDRSGMLGWVERDEHDFSYRSSVFAGNDWIITQTVLQLEKGERRAIYQQMAENARKRRESQPLEYASGGSAFKRPAGYFAGKLITEAGLKGLRMGSSGVSEKHAGFIVNYGKAKSSEIMAVFIKVQDEVKKQFGIDLEPEVEFIGDWSGEPMARTGRTE
ncbi:MAG: UDP-N-acetylmuramate dehydrogenase [Saccharofermentanales bacterium]|jgi:UDP-N-acetylmuramate dehydrogenase|nr:UDP-N-acetylmuramate dehydrogenase [Bacillota bacterium]